MVLPAIIILFSIILDQITKIVAQNNLLNNKEITAIPHILGFTYVKNEGAAFGIFSDSRWVFMVFSTVAIFVMFYVLIKDKKRHPLFVVSISMLIGGGIGNMIDRIFRGYVIDFFKFLFVKFAVFNVADCFVTVGAVLLSVYLIFIFDDKSEISEITSDNIEKCNISDSNVKNNSNSDA